MLILADDLTGAADTGVAFAQRGLRTVLRLDHATDIGQPAITVLSSGSRNGLVEDAVARVRSCLAQARAPVYKKLDSVLRGHIAAELLTVMSTLGVDRALIAPAFPAQGRITRGGMQYANGQRIALSLFDTLSQHTSLPIRIVALRDGAVDENQLRHALAQPGIVMADAESDPHLDVIAAMAQQANLPVWCGSAGLAHALARQIGHAASTPHAPATQPSLIVSGSYQPQTQQQLRYLSERGTGLVKLDGDSGNLLQLCVDACVHQLSNQHSVVLMCPDTQVDLRNAAGIAQALGHATRQILAQLFFVPRLILTGGDTALAVCQALEAAAIELHYEFEPGIPVGRLIGGSADGATVLTKSGGFGDVQTLWRALQTA